jgi:phenylacetate-CoA ligase
MEIIVSGKRKEVTDGLTVAAEVTAALKVRIGVKPARVVVHPDGGLDTRSEHKSRRVIDERTLDYSI